MDSNSDALRRYEGKGNYKQRGDLHGACSPNRSSGPAEK